MPSAEAGRGLSGWLLAALLLAAAQTPLGSTIIAVALPDISRSLATDVVLATTLLATTYLMITVIGQGPGGKLADIFGRWRILQLGTALFTAGSLSGVLAPNFWVLVAARSLMALGGALMAPAVLALLRVHVAPEKRGRAFGFYSATVGLAAALGPPLGGELVLAFGWRAAFFANIPLLLLAAALMLSSARPGDNSRTPRTLREFVRSFVWIGTVLLALAVAALAVGRPWSIGLAVAAGASFAAWEWRAADPILQPRLFGTRVFAAGCAVIFLQSLSMYGLLFHLPQFFEVAGSATSRETGQLLFLMMIGLFAASLAGGFLIARLGERAVAASGAAIVLLGVLSLLRVTASAGPMAAFAAVLMIGVGVGASWTAAQSAAMAAVDKAHSGMAGGATSTCRYLGGAIGVLLLGVIGSGAEPGPGEAHRSLVWLFAAAILLSAVGCAALPGRKRRLRWQWAITWENPSTADSSSMLAALGDLGTLTKGKTARTVLLAPRSPVTPAMLRETIVANLDPSNGNAFYANLRSQQAFEYGSRTRFRWKRVD